MTTSKEPFKTTNQPRDAQEWCCHVTPSLLLYVLAFLGVPVAFREESMRLRTQPGVTVQSVQSGTSAIPSSLCHQGPGP